MDKDIDIVLPLIASMRGSDYPMSVIERVAERRANEIMNKLYEAVEKGLDEAEVEEEYMREKINKDGGNTLIF